MANVVIRDQTEADFAAVHELVIAAFKTMPYACGREQFHHGRVVAHRRGDGGAGR